MYIHESLQRLPQVTAVWLGAPIHPLEQLRDAFFGRHLGQSSAGAHESRWAIDKMSKAKRSLGTISTSPETVPPF